MTFELINKETLYTPVTLFVMPFSADTDRPCCRLKMLSSPLLLVGPLGSSRAYPYEQYSFWRAEHDQDDLRLHQREIFADALPRRCLRQHGLVAPREVNQTLDSHIQAW
jgi:hypothetical protein